MSIRDKYTVKKQHGICVKGWLPSMLNATMKVAAGTSVEICFAAEASLTWGVWRLDHCMSELQIRVLLEVGCAGLKLMFLLSIISNQQVKIRGGGIQ